MEFTFSLRAADYQDRLCAFMDERIYPAEPVYAEQMAEAGDPHFHPPILEALKSEAKSRGLWNLFNPHKDDAWGSPGLSNLDYAPLAEPRTSSCAWTPTGVTTCSTGASGSRRTHCTRTARS